MNLPWEEHEVYRLTMDSPLSELHGVGSDAGSRTLSVFRRAGFTKLGDLYGSHGQEAAVRAAAEQLAVEEGTADTGHWRAIAARCVTVIRRVRSAEAQPYPPEHFLCPILGTVMDDPVVTKYGYTYERHAIERVVNDPNPAKRLDPVARRPLTDADLFPNRVLKDAIEYYMAHAMRFVVPIRVAR